MWIETNYSLVQTWIFNDFITAFAFLTKVAIIAEKHNHHPKIINTYNKVELQLTTHDAGNRITEKDRQLAAAIDKLYSS